VEQSRDTLAGTAQIARRADAVPTGAVGAIRKNAHADGAKPSAIAVDRNCAAGIVDLQNAIVEKNAAAHQQAGQSSDHDGSRGRHKRARRCDRHQSG
jgi:hypothetical protein